MPVASSSPISSGCRISTRSSGAKRRSTSDWTRSSLARSHTSGTPTCSRRWHCAPPPTSWRAHACCAPARNAACIPDRCCLPSHRRGGADGLHNRAECPYHAAEEDLLRRRAAMAHFAARMRCEMPMRSLLFWRKKAPPAADRPQPAAPLTMPAPEAAPAETPPVLPGKPLSLQCLVYALALSDPRAADMDARPEPEHLQLMLDASAEFARVGSEPRYTPHRPSLLPQLLEVMNDEDASLRALARIVAQDPQLTGDLLRTANSALYRVSPQPVESVERATSLLGTQGIRMLIASRLVQPLAGAGGQLGRFGDVIWEHSLYSA